MDVVYNHTNASGNSDYAVLDKIVPGYYHRLSEYRGGGKQSTCCSNTATENYMMEPADGRFGADLDDRLQS